jgi:accessory gene regulator B
MNFIDQTASNLVSFIRKNHEGAAPEKVLFYSLSLIINSLLAIITSIIISLLTGHLQETIIVIACYSALRYVSGGIHMPTSLMCCLLSITVFVSCSLAEFNYFPIACFLDVISIIILYKTAPQGIENVSKINKKYYPHLKFISILIVLLNFYFHSSILSTAFFIQSFFTTSTAHSIVSILERRLRN